MPWAAQVLLIFTLGMALGSWTMTFREAYQMREARLMAETGVAMAASALSLACVMIYG